MRRWSIFPFSRFSWLIVWTLRDFKIGESLGFFQSNFPIVYVVNGKANRFQANWFLRAYPKTDDILEPLSHDKLEP